MAKFNPKILRLGFSNCLACFDFDNTITPFDVFDDIVERFSVNQEWLKFERLWKQGKIGSSECLRGQLKSVRITKKNLLQYLSTIRLDPDFKKLLVLFKKKRIRPIILSDNFSFIIRHILGNNGIRGLKVYSNRIRFSKDRLIPSFPHLNLSCFRCGHCKKSNLLKNNFRGKIIYIGDGLSDVCPAEQADIVFAKGSLLKYFKKKERHCIGYKDLSDISNYLKAVNQ